MRSIPFYLSLALIFTIPWENAVTVGALGTLARVTGMVTVTIWLGSALLERRFRRPHLFHAAVCIFGLWNILSLYWTADQVWTSQRIATYLQMALLVYVLWDLYRTTQALRAGLQAYILGAYVSIGSTILNFLHGHQIERYAEGRFAGADVNACDLVVILAMGLPVAWHLATTSGDSVKDRILQPLNYLYIPASLFAITLTASRIALFAVIPAVLYIAGTANRIRPSFRLLMLVAFIATLFIVKGHIPNATFERLSTVGSSIEHMDLNGRVRLWRASITTFSDHPILGIGSGALCSPRELGGVAHNTFISVLTELGMVGFIFFAFILSIVIYHAIRQSGMLSGLWVTVLAIWCIGVSSLTFEYAKTTWLFFSLVVISAHSFLGDHQTGRPSDELIKRQ